MNDLPKGFSYVEDDVQLPKGFSFVEDDVQLPKGFSYIDEEEPQKQSIFGDTKPLYEPSFPTPEEEEKPWYSKIWDSFGRSLAMQSQVSGGGGPQAVPVYKEAGKEYLSKRTFGLTENIDALKPINIENLPEEERDAFGVIKTGTGTTAEFRSLNNLMKVFKLPGEIATGSGPLKQSINSLKNVLKAFGVGATEESLKEVFAGKDLDSGEIVQNGVTWALIDTLLMGGGKTASLLKGFFERGQKAGKNPYELLNKFTKNLIENKVNIEDIDAVSKEAIDYFGRNVAEAEANAVKPEFKSKSLREKKVDAEVFDTIESQLPKEPDVPVVKDRYRPENPTKITESELDVLVERSPSNQKLGNDIKKDISLQEKAARAEYEPAYELVKEATESVNPTTTNLIKSAESKRLKLGGRFKTKPADYDKTGQIIENIIEDLGGVRDSNGNLIFEKGANQIPMSDLMELGKRTGQLAKYGDYKPSVRDAIKSLNQEIKKAIRESMPDEDAKKMWEFAEGKFAEKSEIFNNSMISRIKSKNFNAEDVVKLIENPSDIQKIKKAISSEQYKSVERELLSKMNDASYDKSKKLFRELRQHVSEDSKKLAEEIILSKKPISKLTPKDKSQKLEKWVTDNLVKPTKSQSLLDSWLDPKMNQKIRKSLENNPNKKEIIDFLNKESAFRASKKIVNSEGVIDFQEFKKFVHNAGNRSILRSQVGEEGLKFLDSVAGSSDMLLKQKKIMSQLKNMPLKNFKVPSKRGDEIISKFADKISREKYPNITYVKDLMESLGDFPKGVLTSTGIYKFGPVKTAIAFGGWKFIEKIAKTPRLRNAFKKAMKTDTTNPYVLYSVWKGLESLD